MAHRIQNKHDPQASQVATLDALQCAYMNDPSHLSAAQELAQSTALEQLNSGRRGNQDFSRRIEQCRPQDRRHAGRPYHHPGLSRVFEAR